MPDDELEDWTMSEEEWLTCKAPWRMLLFLNKSNNDRKLRLFACAAARTTLHLLSGQSHELGTSCLEIGESLADSLCSRETAATWRGKLAIPGDFQPAAAAVWSALAIPNPDGWEDMRIVASHASHFAAAAIEPTNPQESVAHCNLIRDIFGPLPFRLVHMPPQWITPAVGVRAHSMYKTGVFDELSQLGNEMEQSGCNNTEILDHCSNHGRHTKGCWIIDRILGKE